MVPKDWTTIKSNELLEHLCMAMHGNQGWSKHKDFKAKYPLVCMVTASPIYGDMRVAIEDLQAELQVEDLDEL